MAEHEPVLEALSLDPPAVRPGETVTVRFDAPNVGSAPTAAGSVVFEADALLAPLGETHVAIPPVAPGERAVACVTFRLDARAGDVAPLGIGAVLSLGDARYRAAPALLAVRTAPLLNGALSGTFVAWRDDGETLDVRATTVNEGDGAARDVRLVVPPPAGCVRIAGDEEAVCARLEPGAQLEVAFVARVVAPPALLAADAAVVRAAGFAARLPVRTSERSVPQLAAPQVDVNAGRRRSTIAIAVRNDGWADASNVALTIVLARGMRAQTGGIAVDGIAIASRAPRRGNGSAAAVASIDGGTVSLTIAAAPARSTTRIDIETTHPAACGGGTITVESAAGTAETAFVPVVAREVRLRLVRAPAPAAEAQTTDVEAVACNAGDGTERLRLHVDGADAADEVVELAPGCIARRRFAVTMTDRAACDAVALIAFDEGGERARVAIPLTAGAVPLDVAPAPTRDDAALPECPPLSMHLDVPQEVEPGCPFDVECIVETTRAIASLRLKAPAPAGVHVVAGSTRVDGRVVRETGAVPPLERGIDLRRVSPNARIAVRWSLVADAAVAAPMPHVVAVADELTFAVCAPEITVRRVAVFPTIDERLSFRLASHALEDPAPVLLGVPSRAEPEPEPEPEPRSDPIATAPVERAPIRLSFDAHGDTMEIAARLLRGDPAEGLAAYLPVLGALFPTASSIAGADPALTTARAAIGDGFDRLHVLLRLPNFIPAPDDLEDAAQRRALVGLYRALEDGAPTDDVPRDDAFVAELDPARLGDIVGSFADARFGSPSALRAIVALIPRRCDDEPLLTASLQRYLATLDDALRRCERLGGEGAERALASGRDPALEDARNALAAALRAHALAGERR